jgi:hypothetical protein
MGTGERMRFRGTATKAEALEYELLRAFPRDLGVEGVLEQIPAVPPRLSPGIGALFFFHVPPERKNDSWWLEFCGEVMVPSRIYYEEPAPSVWAGLNAQERLVLACIYTRHDNGFVREKYLREVLKSELPEWTLPFIVLISGEYVIEITRLLYNTLRGRDNATLKAFCAKNPHATRLAFARMASYWNLYHRHTYPNFRQYVGRSLFSECFGYR